MTEHGDDDIRSLRGLIHDITTLRVKHFGGNNPRLSTPFGGVPSTHGKWIRESPKYNFLFLDVVVRFLGID